MKRITRAKIMGELVDKFSLQEYEREDFLFGEFVVPTYDIGAHVKHRTNKYFQTSVTGTGPLSFAFIPSGERWTLHRYDVVFMGLTFTVSGIYTRRGVAATQFCYLDLGAAKAASYHIALPQPAILDPGDVIYVNVDGFTSTNALRLYLDYEVEELR